MVGHSLGGLFASRPRRIIVATAIIVALLSAGAYAYWSSPSSPAGPSVTLTSPPLQLSMSLDKTGYLVGENMTMRFYLRNISNETVTLTRPSQWPADGSVITAAEGVATLPGQNLLAGLVHFGFTITDRNGTQLFQFGRGGFMGEYDIVLDPDASLNQTLFYNTKYDLLDNNGQPIQPGAYQIRASLYAYQSSDLYTRETPSIAFTLASTA